MQVNVAGEPQKGGCDAGDVRGARRSAAGRRASSRRAHDRPARGRRPAPHFAALRELGERLGVPELSMGMTDDFEAAIGEGATMVRVGSAVFGPRPGGVGLRR